MRLILGDCLEKLKELPADSVDCVVTSPPYYALRDYGVNGQLGLESSPIEYVEKLRAIFAEVKRVLKKEGTLWLNLGDSYAGGGNGRGSELTGKSSKQKTNRGATGQVGKAIPMPKPKDFKLKSKDLMGIPWRVAFALQDDGWYLRQDIIWHKPNPMPESVDDRCTKSHEYIFLLSKSARYYYDAEAILEPFVTRGGKTVPRNLHPSAIARGINGQSDQGNCGGFTRTKSGKNKRSVWTVTTKPFKGAHFATFPPDLIEPCVLAGCPKKGVVLDPFMGAGTTGLVAKKHGREFIGIELNPEYLEIARKRIECSNQTQISL